MLKEIVQFTDLLEENGIIDEGLEKKQKTKKIKVKVIEATLNTEKKWQFKKVDDENREKYYIQLFKSYGVPIGVDNNKSIAGSQGVYTASFFMFQYQWSYQKNNKKPPKSNNTKEWKQLNAHCPLL